MNHATMNQSQVENRLDRAFGEDTRAPVSSWEQLLTELTPEQREAALVVRKDWLGYQRSEIQYRYRLGGLVNKLKDKKDKYGKGLVDRLAGEFDLTPERAYEAGRVADRIPMAVLTSMVKIAESTGNDRLVSWTHLRHLSESDQLPKTDTERITWLTEQIESIAREKKSVSQLDESLQAPTKEATPVAEQPLDPKDLPLPAEEPDPAPAPAGNPPVKTIDSLLEGVVEAIATERAEAGEFRQELLTAVRSCPEEELWGLRSKLEEVLKKYQQATKRKAGALKEAIELTKASRAA